MFANVGRSLDPWYWFRMLVAAWLVLCGLVLGGYAVLGYLFLRFLLWMFFALLALFFPIVNPISIDEFLSPRLEVVEVDLEAEPDEPLDFDIEEPPWTLDMEPPEPPPVEEPSAPTDAGAVDLVQDELVEVVTQVQVRRSVKTASIMAVLGSTSAESGAVTDLWSDEAGAGILGSLETLDDAAVIAGTGSVSSGRGGLIGLGGVEGRVQGGLLGGAPGGVVGGIRTGSSRVTADWQELTFKRTPKGGLPDVECAVRVVFGTDGRLEKVRPTRCPEHAQAAVVEGLRRWRIEPWRVDGAARSVQTTIFLPFEG